MTLSEKIAYIKGLADNSILDPNDSKDKIIFAIVEALEEISTSIDEIDEELDEITEQLDAVDEDLASVEDDIYEDEDDYEDDDDLCYEVTCPTCNDTIYLDDEIIEEGGIKCPNCGQELEFDFDDCCSGECENGCNCDEDK